MANKKARIVIVGSANVDLTTFTDKFPKAGLTFFPVIASASVSLGMK